MSKKRKKTDANDAQVETLVGTEQQAGGAGDGQAAGTAGEPTAAADTDALDATAPADGGDDAGGEDGGAAGDQAAGAGDEGGEDGGAAGDQAAGAGDEGGAAAEGDVDPGPPTILCVVGVDRLDATVRANLGGSDGGDGEAIYFAIADRPVLLDATDEQIADCTIEATALVWPEWGERLELQMENTLLEDARLLDGDDKPDDEPDGPMDLDILAACAAAAVAFGTRRSNDHTLPTADYGFLTENPLIRAVAECAAEFVRGNGDVSPAVIPIHLSLKGLRPQEPVTHREYAAWTVFAATLKALDTMRATEAADEEAQARAKEASERRHSAPRDRLALMPQEGALTPSGFTPSR